MKDLDKMSIDELDRELRQQQVLKVQAETDKIIAETAACKQHNDAVSLRVAAETRLLNAQADDLEKE